MLFRSNAIKYHNYNQKSPFINVSVSANSNSAQITIEDNGIGIAPEHQHKIFDMFYRIKGDIPGSGLGLYLVKEIIDKLKGTIELQSQLNQGTKFIIILSNLTNETIT